MREREITLLGGKAVGKKMKTKQNQWKGDKVNQGKSSTQSRHSSYNQTNKQKISNFKRETETQKHKELCV